MSWPPMPPSYVFVFDVSKSAVDSGYLSIAVGTIQRAIEEDKIPGGDWTQVAFLTYDDNVHFYNLKSTLKQPQIII